MAKILIVDDSALMRKLLRDILEKAGFKVDTAQNGMECLKKIPLFAPDAISLDINMPIMDGMSCLSAIMKTNPTPVVMVSSLTKEGAIATLEALELGAVDFFPKPTQGLAIQPEFMSQFVEKMKVAVNTKVRSKLYVKGHKNVLGSSQLRQAETRFITGRAPEKRNIDLVVIGVSTGGPSCLQEILQNIPESFCAPIVIAQHMPARFTEVFAQRLNHLCKQTVTEVTALTPLQAGHIYIAKGDADIKILQRGSQLMVNSISSSSDYVWHPSVSLLVDSALSVVKPAALLCIQLTGMGNDGAHSMFTAHEKGAYCIAESSDTAVVYGMPKELVKLGGANQVLPNHKIAKAMNDLVK